MQTLRAEETAFKALIFGSGSLECLALTFKKDKPKGSHNRRHDRPCDSTAGAGATIGCSGNNSPGTLTVSDGMYTARIAPLGNYMASNFTASS
jgi:hypothetical protein